MTKRKLFESVLKLILSVAIASLGLYISLLWLLRDILNEPQLAFILESSPKAIFVDIIIPLLLLGLSYAAIRDSLFEFIYILRKHVGEKKRKMS